MENKTLEQIVKENPTLSGSEIQEIFEREKIKHNDELIKTWEDNEALCDILNAGDGCKYLKDIYSDSMNLYRLYDFRNENIGKIPTIYCSVEEIIIIKDDSEYSAVDIQITMDKRVRYNNYNTAKKNSLAKAEYYRFHNAITNIKEMEI